MATTWLKSIQQECMDRKSACCSPSSENCSFTLEVSNTCAMTLGRKSGVQLILNSAVFSYVRKEAPFHLSLTRWCFPQRLSKGGIKVRIFHFPNRALVLRFLTYSKLNTSESSLELYHYIRTVLISLIMTWSMTWRNFLQILKSNNILQESIFYWSLYIMWEL